MKFSIVTATYNSERYIRSNVESLLSQTYSDFEHLIIDNVSSDSTLQIIRDLYSNSPHARKVKIYSEKDNGISDAFNKGISKASGDIILILSSDDYISDPDILKNVHLAFQKGADIVHGNVIYVDENFGTQVRRPLNCKIEEAMPFNHPSMFLKKKIYEEKGFFSDSYRFAMDYEHTARFYRSIEDHEYNIRYLDSSLVVLRAGGASYKNELKSIQEARKFFIEEGLWKGSTPLYYYLRILRLKTKKIILALHLDFIVSTWRAIKWG